MVIFDSFTPLPKLNIPNDGPILTGGSVIDSNGTGDFPTIPNNAYTRRDGRQTEEIRPVNLRTNVIGAADGSAYVSIGKTKVLCGVYGPNISKQNTSDNGLSINVDFITGPFCGERDSFNSRCKSSKHQNDQHIDVKSSDKLKSILLEKIINSVVCHSKYRRNKIECYFYLIEDDGSSFSATIVASCLALCDAKIELIGLYSSIQIIATPFNNVFKDSHNSSNKYILLIDPTNYELSQLNNNYSSLELGICTVRNQIVYMSAIGDFFSDQNRIEEAFSLAEASCSVLVNEIKDYMISQVKNSYRKNEGKVETQI